MQQVEIDRVWRELEDAVTFDDSHLIREMNPIAVVSLSQLVEPLANGFRLSTTRVNVTSQNGSRLFNNYVISIKENCENKIRNSRRAQN